MNAEQTHTDNEADVQLPFFVQIPQGTPIELEIKVEPGQYTFYLNKTVLKQIAEAREIGCSLYIPPKLLAYLWYYNCFSDKICFNKNATPYTKLVVNKNNFKIFDNTFIVKFIKLFWSKSLQNKSRLQYGLTFNSYYREDTSALYFWKEQDIILQSNILFYGDIIHKIRSDFIQNPQCLNIIYVHYWLIEQILNCLRTQLNLLVWEIAFLFPAGFLVYNLHLANWMLVIFAWLGLTILFATTRYIVVNQFQSRTSINSKFINRLIWTLICFIPSVVVATTSFSNLTALFLPLFSLITPKFVEYILNFTWGRVVKLIMRPLLRNLN
ncbi:MAG: hypothetical protein RMY16_03670 [Nostoc sp. DedQUE12b]|uniref:hypothetical protein n=1 Tax=Nostoc sp. DedQUE12b TaxID=3075398 RepID=UPI002AD21625|nr:hypothetical protein [Nostoc sp. DedQUE12b]MDZ8084683.1 hypothetical protein [Nostoc sp. DedQUE12b]